MPRFPAPEKIAWWTVAGLVALALVLVFVLPGDALIAARDTDMVAEFVAWRAYLADSLRAGHIPLWNPYTYGGQPFLAGFESAVLYPPNLLFAVMPIGPAINFSVLLHLIILGWGMQRWAVQRGLDPRAAALAGIIAPLSGAVAPHVYAGHLSNLCTMAWAPWIFLGLERGARLGDRRGWILASAGVCLQILAGHVQYVFYTGVAAGVHAVVLALSSAKTVPRWRPFAGLAGCYAAAALLGAAQLLPSFAASSESIRQQKLEHDFAAMFGFPPENFLTLLAPGFFGNLGQPIYWGRCYLWEMSLFLGTASLVLIAVALANQARRRQAWLDLAVALPLLLIALGNSTPLFDLLYNFAPGFGHFRSWSKFIFQATLFLVLVIASGADALLRGEKISPRFGWASIIGGGASAVVGMGFLLSPDSIAPALHAVMDSRQSYLPPQAFTDATFIGTAGTHAGLSLLLGGAVLAATGTILLAPRQGAYGVQQWGVPVLVVAEMIGFVAGQVQVAHVSDAAPPGLKQFFAAHPGDYRTMLSTGQFLNLANDGFLLGVQDLWGNNPTLLRRYAEFMTCTQDGNPNEVTQYVTFNKVSPLYAMLRLRYATVVTGNGIGLGVARGEPLPHVLLVSDANVLAGRDAIFAAMSGPAFDPRQTVLLESAPTPAPQSGAKGFAKMSAWAPESLEIEAETDKPAILLVTDLYANGWRAEPLAGSAQQSYTIMPGDYILRAIPLAAGHHHLRVVYAPSAFPIGVAISALAWLLLLGAFHSTRRLR